MKLKKGDAVVVRSGKDKGKSGTILKVFPALNTVVVDGINILKRAQKPSTKNPKGGITSEPHPIAVSKLGIAHPDTPTKTSRIGYKVDKNGDKQRVYRQASNKVIKDNAK